MRISHFFIDRPIFASVVAIVFVILGGVAFTRLPIAQYPEISPPTINVTGQYPGASAAGRRRDGGDADRAADQRRREHALHVLELDRRRPLLDRRHLRHRHQSRHRPGAGAEPRRHRAAAPAGRRAHHRRHRQQGLARPDDGRASAVARQFARPAVRLQLRHARDHRRAHPRRRRRLDHRVRQPRLRHARLARSRPAAVARPDRGRRGHRAAGPERPGRLRRARTSRRWTSPAPSRSRCRRKGGSPIPEEFGNIVVKQTANAVVRLKDVGRVELAAQDYSTNSYLDTSPAVAIGIFQRPGSNALATADRIEQTMADLSKRFPPGHEIRHRLQSDPVHLSSRSTRCARPSSRRSSSSCW